MATCIVSFLDLDGVRHSVEVQAEGLYEAAGLGIAAFKRHDLNLNPKGLAQLEVEVRSSITHTVTVQRVHQWLQQAVRSPKEAGLKERLRALL
jgi:hypothetical protein